MEEFSSSSLAAGMLAYLVALIIGAGPLVYLAYRLDIALTKEDDEKLLKAGHRSTAIELGTTILCQALLIRHAVFTVMAVVRSIFIEDLSRTTIIWIWIRSALIFAVLGSLSLLSVWIASRIFKRMTRRLKEEEEIYRDNVAAAIFFAMVLLAITMVLNEGMAEFSRSLIPYGRTGLMQMP